MQKNNIALLAIETSSEQCSAAALHNQYIVQRSVLGIQKHAGILLDLIDEVLEESQLKLAELTAVCYGRGPGSFTGLRIAASATQALAFTYDHPVIAVSSLDALAWQAWQITKYRAIAVAIDARMQELYYGYYIFDETGNMLDVVTDQLALPEQLILPAQESWYGVGNGWAVMNSESSKNKCQRGINSDCYPDAKAIVQLAAQRWQTENDKGLSAEQAQPVYVRDKIA